MLLVEGRDDQRVVESLYRIHEGEPPFNIVDKQGIAPLLKSINVEVKTYDRQVVGILADANDDPAARWQAIRARLSPEYALPAAPTTGGVVIGTEPRVGVWLMPDNLQPGELEDFVIQMLPTDDPVWPLAQLYIDDIPAADRKFPPGKVSRAKLHAWLATREDPRLMGQAITTRDLAIDGELCQQFVGWLRRLFA